MCTRFVLLQEHLRAMLRRLGLDDSPEFLSRYNIAPGSLIPAVRVKPGASARESVALRWGLVPAWAKADDATMLVNARAETLSARPAFREAFKTRRCVIPATGFYEWEKFGQARKPWFFRRRDEQPFGLAGLWERWRAPDGATLESCAVITTEPNELMRPIHHRMPVMLTPEQFEPWLDVRVTEPEQLAPLLAIARADLMSAVTVSKYVNSVQHEGPPCLAPAASDDAGGPQLSLGF